MNKWMISAAITGALPLSVAAQNPGAAFQYVFTGGSGDGAMTVTGGASGVQVVSKLKTVTGVPLSATEERHTVQVLGDGTRIESRMTDKFYRDNQGRTRVEREDGTVSLNDPVADNSAEMSSNGYVVRRSSRAVSSATADSVQMSRAVAALSDQVDQQLSKLKAEAAAKRSEQTKQEDLGFQSMNGVSAQGTRTTTTIPAGQIGNDRPIQTISERWVSPELQLLIKSSNKDPRFGETTYEMTNIIQGAPDPALFQIPGSSHQ